MNHIQFQSKLYQTKLILYQCSINFYTHIQLILVWPKNISHKCSDARTGKGFVHVTFQNNYRKSIVSLKANTRTSNSNFFRKRYSSKVPIPRTRALCWLRSFSFAFLCTPNLTKWPFPAPDVGRGQECVWEIISGATSVRVLRCLIRILHAICTFTYSCKHFTYVFGAQLSNIFILTTFQH